MRWQSIFRHPECFRHFLPLTRERCGEHLIPLCLYHASPLKSTYGAPLIVHQYVGCTSKYAEASFSLLGAYSLSDEIRPAFPPVLSSRSLPWCSIAPRLALSSEGQETPWLHVQHYSVSELSWPPWAADSGLMKRPGDAQPSVGMLKVLALSISM